jgi:hypothetical protein
VPQAIAEEITASFTGIDEAKAARLFSDICGQVGCEDLYAVYGIQSQTVHPSVATSNAYIDVPSGALQLTPRLAHEANVSLVAHCLIWTQRAFDRLMPTPSRAEQLEKLANSIQARPVLPDYKAVTPKPQAGRTRSRRSRRKK